MSRNRAHPPAPRSRDVPRAAARAAPAPTPAWVSVAVAAAILTLDLLLAPHVAGDGDSAELTVVLATLGLSHPTGYPLYTVLGHGFCTALLALGAGWEWAANAWSALGAAVAIGLWHRFATLALA